MSHAAAPGKIILFGEHSVVFGEPALAIGIDRETRVDVRAVEQARGHTVNGRPLNTHAHLFIERAIELLWEKAGHTTPLQVRTSSRLPSAAGLGSSAALSTATCAALLHLTGQFSELRVARAAYETEWLGQGGRGSPIDTSASAHGKGIYVAADKGSDHLWTMSRGDRTWHVHDLDVPELPLVVAHSGEKGKTAEIVAKVAMYVERTAFADDIIRDLGDVTRKGRDAVTANDLIEVGRLMDESHELLGMLGVSTSRLDELCRIAREHAYGAKLTGAGAGGCMVALAKDPDACRDALEAARAETWIVRPAKRGARAWGRSLRGPSGAKRRGRQRRDDERSMDGPTGTEAASPDQAT